MAILVLNAGSSSLKFALIDNASGQAHLAGNETLGAEGLAAALERALAALPQGCESPASVIGWCTAASASPDLR